MSCLIWHPFMSHRPTRYDISWNWNRNSASQIIHEMISSTQIYSILEIIADLPSTDQLHCNHTTLWSAIIPRSDLQFAPCVRKLRTFRKCSITSSQDYRELHLLAYFQQCTKSFTQWPYCMSHHSTIVSHYGYIYFIQHWSRPFCLLSNQSPLKTMKLQRPSTCLHLIHLDTPYALTHSFIAYCHSVYFVGYPPVTEQSSTERRGVFRIAL